MQIVIDIPSEMYDWFDHGLPNAKLILWGRVVDYGDTGCRYSDVNKTKNISY